MRVFLDANVIFSASNSGSNIEKLVNLLLRRGIAVSSDLAIEEARRNILAKRPQWSASFEKITLKIEEVESVGFGIPVDLDEKDLPLLCAAIRSRCNYFVTGDKRDFGHLFGKTVEGVQIVTLVQLADLLSDE